MQKNKTTKFRSTPTSSTAFYESCSLHSHLDIPDVFTSSDTAVFDVDSTLALECSFEAVPLPLLEWMHNGLPVSSSNGSITVTNTTSSASGGTFRLEWLHVPSDAAGTFECVANNSIGSDSWTINVQIRSKLVNVSSFSSSCGAMRVCVGRNVLCICTCG